MERIKIIRQVTALAFGVVLFAGVGGFQAYGDEPWAGESSPSKPSEKGGLPFQVPPGFVAERVAGPPVVEYPMVAGFDERGRLFVAHSAGRNVKGAEQLLKELPNSIRLLEDTHGDGHFDKYTVFADKMTIPTGALWHDGALYVCSPPYLWRLKDSKGAGVADQRQELVGKFSFWGHTGDIHGPFLGPEGRLYWTDGLVGHRIERRNGSVMQGNASRIYRCKADGDEIEEVCGGGMDNPVMMAFTAEGEPFATSTLLNGYPARYDGVIYCIDGGVYPHHASMIAEFKRTGDLLPPVANLGHVSPSGIIRYRSTAFGAEYRDNLFVTQFNTHKVQRLIVERDGATFRIRNEDFLVSKSDHFHPTDVREDADGSLLVVDTGGWFTIGCHVSILKPEVKGGIYRIRRKGAPRIADPRGLALPWDRLTPAELTKLLDDPRWVVRDRAVFALAKRGAGALGALKDVLEGGRSVQARRNAVWALTRLESREALALIRPVLHDKDMSLRLSAAHAVGLLRDADAEARLRSLVVKDDIPAVRRQAATALGRIKRAAAVPALLEALRAGGDRFLEHALIYALIQIDDRDATLKGLADPSPQVRRGALIALDQMDHGNLTQELVTPLLDTDDPALQKEALAVLSARGWAKQVVGLLGQWLEQKRLPAERQESLRGAILALCKDPAVQGLVARSLRREETPVATRLLLLETLARAPLDKLPAAWTAEVGRSLQHSDPQVVRQAMATIRAARIGDFDEALLRLAQDKDKSADLRLAAAAAAAPRITRVEPALFEFLLARLDPELPPLTRLETAGALGSTRLDDDQLKALTRAVGKVGPLEMPHLLAAYEHSQDAEVGRDLVAALDRAPGLASLAPEALRRTLQAYPEEVRQAAQPLFKRLEMDTAKQKARLTELEPVLKGGDAGRGREVFFGRKASCTACHTVQTKGGKVGPDLTTIGAIRSASDLLETIVFPSASFARGYEPYVVATKGGQFHSGILKRETADAIYLATADRAEIRIARADIDSIEPGKVSIMPQGLDTQLSRQELADLIAFLRSLR
jgi:putative membrane-bound dehydrogenase-like protein